jgi:hypothetical protein
MNVQSFITPEKAEKPLKMKAYGSIGHLPNSRMGPADHHVHEGQAVICTQKPRKGDRIIVSEKLDGSCMSVANIDGELVPLTRSGYRATDVTYEHLRAFHPWVEQHLDKFSTLLRKGERVVGEWIPMAHGTIYDPKHLMFSPFVAFDIFRDGKRILWDEFDERIAAVELRRAFRIHDGAEPCTVDYALRSLRVPDDCLESHGYGFHGAREDVEGAVWRVEREGRVDFLAKYVRPDKIDGKYFPQISGQPEIWFIDRPGTAVPSQLSRTQGE